MGNCYGSSSKPEMQQHNYIPAEDSEFLHHHDLETTSTQSNTPFLGTPLNELTTSSTMLPMVDPRLVSLLDFFRQLHARRKDVYNKVMPVHREDFKAIFNKMRNVQQLEKKNSKMGGVIRQRSLSFGDKKDLKLERFKVKPIDSGGVQTPPDGKGGGVSKPAGSK